MGGARATGLAAAAALAYGLVAVFAWSEPEWRPEWDGSLYLLTARSLAAGEGYRYLGEPFFLRPPGLSLALAPWVGAGGEIDFAALNRLVAVCAAVALFAIALALRRWLPPGWALGAALLAITTPGAIAQLNWIQSDLPALACLYGAIHLLDPPRGAAGRARLRMAGGALLLLLAVHLRTIALLLLPGIALLALRAPDRAAARRAAAAALAVAALSLPWLLHARGLAAAAERPAEQLLLFDYWTALLRVDPGDPGSAFVDARGWLDRLGQNARGNRADAAAGMLSFQEGPAVWLLAAAVLLGAASRWRRGFSLLDWHALSYLLVLLSYFSQDLRLLLPLYPVLYGYALLGTRCAGAWLAARVRRPALAVAVPALAAALLGARNLAALPHALDAASMPAGVASLGEQWESHRRVAAWLRENTPPDATVLAGNAPVLSLLSERRVYSFRFRRSPGIAARYAVDYAAFYPASPRDLERETAASAARMWRIPVYGGRHEVRIYSLPGEGRRRNST